MKRVHVLRFLLLNILNQPFFILHSSPPRAQIKNNPPCLVPPPCNFPCYFCCSLFSWLGWKLERSQIALCSVCVYMSGAGRTPVVHQLAICHTAPHAPPCGASGFGEDQISVARRLDLPSPLLPIKKSADREASKQETTACTMFPTTRPYMIHTHYIFILDFRPLCRWIP